jgi:hypothetical protein
MSAPPGFLLSPELLGKVRTTIARVDGDVGGGRGWKIPTRLEGDDGGGGGRVFRICTFTGAWSIAATKTVTFKYQTATPNTAVATNLFAAVPSPSGGGSGDCAIAKEGTAWFLIAAVCS